MIHMKSIQEKEVDISLDEASNSDKTEEMQILDEIFDIINEKINIIMDNNARIFDN